MKKTEKRIINGVEKLVVVEVVEKVIEELDAVSIQSKIDVLLNEEDVFDKQIKNLEEQINTLESKRQVKVDEITVYEGYLQDLQAVKQPKEIVNDDDRIIIVGDNVTIEKGVEEKESTPVISTQPTPVPPRSFGRFSRR